MYIYILFKFIQIFFCSLHYYNVKKIQFKPKKKNRTIDYNIDRITKKNNYKNKYK